MSMQHNPLMAPQVIEAAPAWERRVDESPRAYEAFLLYRDSQSRRLAEVAAKLVPACSIPNVARWSSRHRWQQRAWQWDKENDRIEQEREARDRTGARKRHLAISQEMQSIALHGLLELKAKVASGSPLNMSPGEVENMLDSAIKIERLTLGVEKDRRQFTEIRVFFGTKTYAGEEGHGQPEHYEEWAPNPGGGEDEEDDGEPRKALPEEID
jgi:hypothetical protein